MTEQQYHEITSWQLATFPTGTPISILSHLSDEISELCEDLTNRKATAKEELADCMILLFGAAHRMGMSYEQICQAIENKHQINQARKWQKPDERGVVKHVKDAFYCLTEELTQIKCSHQCLHCSTRISSTHP